MKQLEIILQIIIFLLSWRALASKGEAISSLLAKIASLHYVSPPLADAMTPFY